MAVARSSHSPGLFTLTRGKVFLAVSLAITWWFASILPHYRPAIQASIQATVKARIDEARQKYIPSIKVDWDTGPNDDDPRSAYNVSKVALLIEPRPLPHLVPQILHMISTVPPDWRFVFIGSEKSVVSVGRPHATKHHQVIGKLDLMVLPEPWEIDTKEKVFRLLTDLRFYDEFLPGVEWILKYEADSILCSNSETSLNDWLDWHWVGAPKTPDDHFSGNGGLSLRRVSAIRRVLNFQARYNNTEPEDEWFGKRVYVLPGAKVASGADQALAVEDVYFDNAMGYHVRDGGRNLADAVWKDRAQRKKIINYCPELSMIMDMKLERERCDGDNRQGEIHPPPPSQAEANRKKLEEAQRKAKQEADKAKAAAESDRQRAAAEAARKERLQKAKNNKMVSTSPTNTLPAAAIPAVTAPLIASPTLISNPPVTEVPNGPNGPTVDDPYRVDTAVGTESDQIHDGGIHHSVDSYGNDVFVDYWSGVSPVPEEPAAEDPSAVTDADIGTAFVNNPDVE